ncbi:MAG: type II toxin-antitoxin system prevent-host-death family antitoxin [Propionibacteriaceae bacterium]|jgi:prevent-host-death family protein|nr:type II toxin-antitoxin system prevent-host-death family antitoxin [Propionibacteriaceae bacterium]
MNVQEAKANLSRLLVAAENGEEVVIARHGKPVVRLLPVSDGREFDIFPGTCGDEVLQPLSDADLRQWGYE